MDTFATLAGMEAGDLPAWLDQNPDLLETIRTAAKARAQDRQGLTADEVAALALLLDLIDD